MLVRAREIALQRQRQIDQARVERGQLLITATEPLRLRVCDPSAVIDPDWDAGTS
jgi:hypothetical protein